MNWPNLQKLRILPGAALSLGALLLSLGATPAQAGPVTQELLSRYRQVVALKPNSPEARFDLAMAYCRTVYVEACYFELVKINKLDPGFIDKVLTRYTAALKKDPNDVEAMFRLSFAHFFKDQKSTRPIELQKRILTIKPDYVWSYNYLSFLAYFVENDLPKALQLARKATELEPDNPISHFLLGQGYYKAGELKKAAEEMALSARLRATYRM